VNWLSVSNPHAFPRVSPSALHGYATPPESARVSACVAHASSMKGSIDVDGDVEQVDCNNAARFVISARLEATAKPSKHQSCSEMTLRPPMGNRCLAWPLSVTWACQPTRTVCASDRQSVGTASS